MALVTIKNSEIYPVQPEAPTMVRLAVADILRQRMGRDLGKLIRLVERRVTQQLEEIEAEHKRIVELYSPKDEEGKPVKVVLVRDMTDPAAYTEDSSALFEDTFEVEGIPVSMIASMNNLLGSTWVSPLIIEDEAPQPEAENQ